MTTHFTDIQSLQHVRNAMHESLGTDTVRKLHRPIPWLDTLAAALPLITFVSAFPFIAFVQPGWPGLIAICLIQGWLIQLMPLIGHDLFVHRNLWKGSRANLIGEALFAPATLSIAVYRLGHLRHHAKIGTVDDTEAGLADVNTVARRALFLTLIGFKLARSGKWGDAGANGYQTMLGATDADRQAITRDGTIIKLFFAALLLMAFIAPWQTIVFGYLLPIALVTTVLSSIRVIMEHAVVDPTNPYSLATPYKTGWVSRLLYFVNPGDCHLMHHIFPRVPWYHMPRLVKLAWPVLLEQNVSRRDSLARLLNGWFIRNYQHRSNWPQ